MAVDDVQWLDAASASVLGVRASAACGGAGRDSRRAPRASGTEAAPLGLDRAFPGERLRRLRLGPLSVGATHRLLRERLGVSFPRPTLVQLHETSGGNPFYALELGRALEQSREQRGRAADVPTSLTGLVSARLAALSEDVREVLEPVALLSEPTVSIVEAVASDPTTVRGRLRDSRGRGDPGARRRDVFVSATPCWPRASRRSSTLAGGDRSIAGSRSSSATPSSAPGTLRWARDGPSTEVADELETASADRGLAWRVGGGRRAGRALGLAHAGHGRRRRPPPPPAARGRPSLRERRRGAVACDPRAAPRAAAAGCRTRSRAASARRDARLTTSRDRSDSSSRRSSRPRPILG